jgi:3-oxoadipate enol-lactonase
MQSRATVITLPTSIGMAYDDVGTGPAVVFLHGFPHDRSLWAAQVSAFADRARCVAPDLRGFGGSSATPPCSMEQYADDVAALLDALSIPDAVLVGLSMGGYVAFSFWRRHRSRVRALVLAHTRATADSEEMRARRRRLVAVARSEGSRAVADLQIAAMLGATTRVRNPALVTATHRMLALAPVAGIVGALEAMMERPDSMDLLSTIDVPTLIIAGDEDTVVPASEARVMHEAIAGSQFEVLTGAGHLSNIERPAAFNHVTGEFLFQAVNA